MLNLREADVTQTRFYQEVLQIGRLEGEQQGMQEGIQQGMQEGMQQGMQEGMHQGEANIVIRLLNRRCGSLTSDQIMKVQSLSLDQLDTLGDALLDFKHLPDLENWFSSNIIEL